MLPFERWVLDVLQSARHVVDSGRRKMHVTLLASSSCTEV